MNRNTKIALVVVGSLSLICVLACVGVALLGGRIAGQVFTTDPQQARDIGRQIADYTPPPGYTEQMSMNVLTAKWVIIGPAGRNGVIFMLMQEFGMRREQIELQMRQAVQAQLGTGGSLTLSNASRREVCILRTLVPRCTAAMVSELVWCMRMNTSAASLCTQKRAEARRLV